MHIAVFLRCGKGDLAFKIEMVLSADAKTALQVTLAFAAAARASSTLFAATAKIG